MSDSKTFEEILDQDGVLVYTCRGVSMKSLLKQNSDLLVIRKPDREFRNHDIVLFRTNHKYLLHRIIKIEGDMITTAGDNNTFKDSRIHKDRIIGILSTIVRDGKEINVNDPKLKFYGTLVSECFDLKAACLKLRRKLHRTVRGKGKK